MKRVVGMRITLLGLALALAASPFASAAPARGGHKLPAIVSLTVQPSSLTLTGSRDERTFIVTGRAADGYSVDLSPVARARPLRAIVRMDRDGYVCPVKAGRTDILITAAGRSVRLPVTVRSAANHRISFVREVMPIFSKVGCNAGTCHGSLHGKNGFKLSLRGYDPAFDYQSLIDDVDGRRFNRTDPARSLMLLKPTEAVPHRGGQVLLPGSRYYRILKQWIAEGVQSDVGRAQRASSIEVLPAVPNVTLPGMTQKTVVIARYPDGSTRDVTREAVITSNQPDTAEVSAAGLVRAVRRGEAALLVRYEGNYQTVNMTVLGDRTGYKWKPAPEYSYIDRLVDAKLKKIKALPSGVCDDSTFLRRVSIDLTGVPPTPDQVRAFLAERSPERVKRAAAVDRLLASPDFDDRWTNKWADLLDCSTKFMGDAGAHKFRDWLRAAVAGNMPYNKFVYTLLTASGDAYEDPAANYMRVIRDSSTATEDVTQLFLGVRFSCAKCHDHPFERWTQNQYYQLGAFFAQVAYKPGTRPGDEVIYNSGHGDVINPRTNEPAPAIVPVGYVKTAAYPNPRTALATWLTSVSNPYFSRAMVNRLWSYFLGKGIIDPVDDIRASNPASNPDLLEALNKDFVEHGFDLKHMMRQIVLSRTYQETIDTNRWNYDDTTNFSHAIPRRLEAEQLYDAIDQATGVHSQFQDAAPDALAEQLPDTDTDTKDGFLDLFGRPSRQTPCECERTSEVSLGQALNLINGPTVANAIANPHGRLAELMKTSPTDAKLVSEVFLSVLCRPPTQKEMVSSTAYLRKSPSRLAGAQDLMWALINSPAFLFNR